MSGREGSLEAQLERHGRSNDRARRELIEQALRQAMALTDADGAVLQLAGTRQIERATLARDGEPFVSRAPRPVPEFVRTLLLGGLPRRLGDLAMHHPNIEEEGCPEVKSGPALFVPLKLREQETGYLAAFRPRGASPFGQRDARTLALLAAWAGVALDNLRLSENIEKLAVTDDLTQVYNFRYLKTALRREVRRAGRFRQPLSIIMLDVDNLKSYNDRNGHLRGSFLLREIAQIFAQQVRSWDLVAKYGGDEFTVILPQTEREGAMVVADRLRAAVAEATFPLAATGAITVSGGVAVFPQDAEAPAPLIEAADRALYCAKRNGRNRIETLAREAA